MTKSPVYIIILIIFNKFNINNIYIYKYVYINK